MNFFKPAMVLSAVMASAVVVQPALAQLPVGSGGAAQAQQRAQAQAQQRLQVQVQQRLQVQAQQQAQAQARLQAEAARAARIAQQAANTAQRQAAQAQQRAANGPNVRAGVQGNAHAGAYVGNRAADASVNARLGVQAGLGLPPGMTQADVHAFDNIFGRFNPLRPDQANPGQNEPRGREKGEEEPRPRGPIDRAQGNWRTFDLASRIELATRYRRAEISEMRDHALAAGDAQLMVRAQQMEDAMNAFLAAQANSRAEAEAALANRPAPPRAPRAQGQFNAQGGTQGTLNPRTATRPGIQTEGGASLDGSSQIQR